MRFNPNVHHRHSIRLSGFDYSSTGVYFVTICTHKRLCIFGDISHGEMTLNLCGVIAQRVWDELPFQYPHIGLDEFIAMPNHIHGIVWINDHVHPAVGAQFIAPRQFIASDGVINQGAINQGVINHAPTLGNIVRAFKAKSTRLIHLEGISYFAWQRNYYERVIRNERELICVRQYIQNNVQTWKTDENNPHHCGIFDFPA